MKCCKFIPYCYNSSPKKTFLYTILLLLLLYWRYNPVAYLGVFHGFVTVIFSGVGGHKLHFVLPLPLTCLTSMILPGAYAPTSIAPRVTGSANILSTIRR
jgi:hypothetical protein